MARTPWKLHDYSTGTVDTYEFPINPNTFTPPGRKNNMAWQRTTAPNGQVIFFQGLDDPGEGEFGGVINANAMKISLEAWVEKWYPVQLEDDRANKWWIVLTGVTWTRLNRHIYPDSYEYTVNFTATRQPVA